MLKSIKKGFRYLTLSLDILLMIVIISLSLTLLPFFQNIVADKISSRISEVIPENVEIGDINMRSLNEISVNGIYIEDHHGDTLLSLPELRTTYSLFQLLRGKVIFKTLTLKSGLLRLKKYEGEESLNIKHFFASLLPKDTSQNFEADSSMQEPFRLSLKTVILENFRFELNRPHETVNSQQLNFSDLKTKIQFAEFQKFELLEDTVAFQIEEMGFTESSGFKVEQLASQVHISPDKIIFSAMNLTTPSSDVVASYAMHSSDYSSYQNFNSEVDIDLQIKKGDIGAGDLKYFIPQLQNNTKLYRITGEISGSVDNLEGINVSISDNAQAAFSGDFSIRGLPNPERTFLFVDVDELVTTRKTIEDAVNQFSSNDKHINLPAELDRLGKIRYHGNLTGFLKDIVAYGTLDTKLGTFDSDISIDSKSDIPSYKGHLATSGFNAGTYFNRNNTFGKIAFELDIEGRGFTKSTVKANAIGTVHLFELYGQMYQNISINGEFSDQRFNGDISIHDPNIDFNFIGAINLKDSIKNLTFLAEIQHIKPVYFYPQGNFDSTGVVSTTMNIDISGTSVDNFVGSMDFFNTTYKDSSRQDEIALFNLTASSENSIKLLSVKSDLMHLQVEGNYKFKNLKSNVLTIFDHYIPLSIDETRLADTPDDFDFTGKINHSGFLSRIFIPGFEIDSGTLVHGHFNVKNRLLDLNINSPGINFGNTRLDSLNMGIASNGTSMNSQLTCNAIQLTRKSGMRNFNWQIDISNNQVRNDINWNDETGSNQGSIDFDIDFYDLFKFGVAFDSSFFVIEDSLWNISDSGSISIDSNYLTVNDLSIYSKLSKLFIDGTVSKNPRDTLRLELEQLNLDYFQTFMPNDFKVRAVLDGEMAISEVYRDFLFTANLSSEHTNINEYDLGSGQFSSQWNTEKRAMEVTGHLGFDSLRLVNLSGDYTPRSKSNQLNFSLDLNQIQLAYIQPFVKGILSDMKGEIDAEMKITGLVKAPNTNGRAELRNGKLSVDYTQVAYELKHSGKSNVSFWFYPDYFISEDVILIDPNGKEAKADFKFTHDQFKKFDYDINVNSENFLFLNTESDDNELYYGEVFGTGSLHIYNNQNINHLDVNLRSEKGSKFFLPMSQTGELSERGFIQFTSVEDVKEKIEEVSTAQLAENLNFNLDLKVDPGTEFQIVFDELVGDVIRCTGKGQLKMGMKPREPFSIVGEYELEKGDYLFTLQNIINKRFLIQKGGIIRWNGDPYKGELNLTAVYRLRTKLEPIMGNTLDSSNYKKRVPVELKLNMENQVLSPLISFDVDLPTMDDETKSIVRNELAQPTCMNQQVFTLLILNQFTSCSTDPTATGSSTNFGRTTTSEVLSNQLSNWLSKISDDFDIGFSYRPGDPDSEISDNEVELALSTQLLNDRIILDGNVGYTNSEQLNQDQNKSSDLVGEFTLQYKIREDGKLRVKAFNQVNDKNQLESTHQYTQGVGLYYVKEFDNLTDLLKRNKIEPSDKKKSKQNKKKGKSNKEKNSAVTSTQSRGQSKREQEDE